MVNNVIKLSFAAVGAITGFTLTKVIFALQGINIPPDFKIVIYIVVAISTATLFYSTATKIIDAFFKVLDKFDYAVQNMTLYELTISSAGLVIGLIVANLIAIPFNKLHVVGVPISVAINILFGCTGVAVATGKRNESLLGFGSKGGIKGIEPKVIDTSVIIDGRIVDIIRSGFLEGELTIPSFVLEELRHIADSSDPLKRNRGRRGLDVLNILQKEMEYPLKIKNAVVPKESEVDTELLNVAKKINAKVLTIDYNLSKVANVQGVQVMNINELANAVKPIALPGEEMTVQVIKDGKENGQGIGYLEDGTMIVVEGGRRHMGESVNVLVTSVLQTAAGRMIFAKPKYNVERIM